MEERQLQELTTENTDKFEHVKEEFEDMADTEETNNADQNGGEVKLSVSILVGCGKDAALSPDGEKDEVIEGHESDEWDEAERESRNSSGYLERRLIIQPVGMRLCPDFLTPHLYKLVALTLSYTQLLIT